MAMSAAPARAIVPLMSLMFALRSVAQAQGLGNCSVSPGVLDCSARGFYSVPQISVLDANTTFPFVFNLSSNSISHVNRMTFKFLFKWSDYPVSELYIDHNDIQYMSVDVLNPFALSEVLDLSWNKMENIPENLLSGMSALRRLSLAGNPLRQLDIIIPDTLETLDLHSCGLTSIADRTISGPHLKSLDISNNILSSVKWSLLDGKSVKLEDNPWDCVPPSQEMPEVAESVPRCSTTTGLPTTLTTMQPPRKKQEIDAATPEEHGPPEPVDQLLWSSFGIVEGILVGWLIYFLLLGTAAWVRVRTLRRELARDGNWWLEPRL